MGGEGIKMPDENKAYNLAMAHPDKKMLLYQTCR